MKQVDIFNLKKWVGILTAAATLVQVVTQVLPTGKFLTYALGFYAGLQAILHTIEQMQQPSGS